MGENKGGGWGRVKEDRGGLKEKFKLNTMCVQGFS